MERLSIVRRAPVLAAAFVLSTNLVTANAAVLARFDFEDATGAATPKAEDLALNLSIGEWSDADGFLQSAKEPTGFSISTRSFHDGNRLLLSLAPAPGFKLRLSDISFDARVSATGPSAWQLKLAGNEIGNGTTATSYKSEHLVLNTVFTGPLELALSASGASSSAGTLRLDNFVLQGSLQPAVSAVPIPALGWIFGGSVLGLLRRSSKSTLRCG
jgi:hypothetical protein